MSKYKKARLGDIAEIAAGGTPSRSKQEYWKNGNIPWIKIGDFNGKYLNESSEFITQLGLDSSSAKLFSKGTILYSIFATLGEVAILNIDATTNQAIAGIKIKNEELLSVDYFYSYLTSLKDEVNRIGRGVAQNNINLGILRNFEIPLPSIETQKQIATTLDKVTKIIAENKKLLEKYDLLIKSRFIEMFGDKAIADGKWKVKKLIDVCSLITDGTHQPPKFDEHGTIPFLFVSNIANEKINYDTNKFINEETYNLLMKRTPVELGDILFSIVGSYGHPAIVKENRSFSFQRHIAFIKPIRDLMDSEYLHAVLTVPEIVEQIERKVKGIAQKTLNLSELKTIQIPVPPLELQKQFAAFVQQIDKSKFENISIQNNMNVINIISQKTHYNPIFPLFYLKHWIIIQTMNDIERTEFLNKLKAYKDKQVIKVITGIRRCGKSTLMKMFMNYLLENGVDKSQIIFLNFEDFDNYELLDPKKLHAYIKERLVSGKMTYVFLDEIQNVQDFQRVVDSLFLNPQIDIYMTGSNAYLLSGELATLLSGRYITIEMLPLSFKEFVQALGDDSKLSLSEKYKQYVLRSSFPYVLNLGEDINEVLDYLNGVYSTIVLKDVVSRFKITDTKMLESVVRFVFDNVGNPLSSKRIADTMTSAGRKIDVKTVEKYITALQQSFIVYEAKRYDVKGKEYLKLMEKYYAVDIGLRFLLLGQKANDVGHILENVVYLELIRRGYKVFIGKVDDTEIDFVAQNYEGNLYIQVSATVRDTTTLERELKPLQAVKDNYPKLLLTLDDDPTVDFNGIKQINVLEWLLRD